MGWDGSGNVIRTNGTNTGGTVWQDDADADVRIRADRHDTHDQDLADSIEQALNRNGENTPSTNIGWGAHKITNLGDGNSADDAATVGQVQSQVSGVAQASGTDALTATFSPAITAFTDKTTVYVRAAAANTSTAPTFKPNALAAKTITKEGNQALVAGDIAGADHVLILQYSSSNDVWELLNPARIGQVTATDEELNSTFNAQNSGPFYTGWVDVSVPEVINGPSGWTVSKTGTGQYQINHGLDLSDVTNLMLIGGNAHDATALVKYDAFTGVDRSDADNAAITISGTSDGSLVDADFSFTFFNTEES